MYCHECGTGNTVDSKYCKECGEKINDGYRTMMLSVQDTPVGQTEEELDRLTRLLDMAFWHNEAGNTDAAITSAEAALLLNPNSTTAHSLLGTLYEKKGSDEKAISHFEAVLALNPNSAADATKLEQLRRGVHVKAVAPPIAHQWLPPAMLKLAPTLQKKWETLSLVTVQAEGIQRRPLYAAGAVSAFVLVSGLLLLRPWAKAEATVPTTAQSVSTPAAPQAVAVSRAYSGGEAAPLAQAPVVPMVLRGGSASTGAYTPSYTPAPIVSARDPFAGRPPAASPTWMLPPSSAAPRRAARTAARNANRDLPPLKLAALPPIGGESASGVAPAPVNLPADFRPLPSAAAPPVSVGSVPQHTVVVGSVGGGVPPPTYASATPGRIRITVRQASDDDNSASSAAGAGGDTDSGGASAQAAQQRALALQQGGDFKRARLSYQSAIQAYQAQISAGRDVETAQRGLAACRMGLQICQQSL